MSTGDPRESFRNRRVLITGGLGFIGSNLARALVDVAAEVVLLDALIPEYGGNKRNVAGLEDRVTVTIADMRDRDRLPELVRGYDVVFNLAGQTSHLDSMTDPYTDLDINCAAQLSLLEACRRESPDARIVFASTRQIYGRPNTLPVAETHPVAPVDVNGINKAAGESYHLLYGEVYGMHVVALRLTNTYGPRMRVRDARQTFLGYWIRSTVQGENLVVYGDGTQRRDFTYVDDAVEAFLLAAARDEARGEVYNLGGVEHVSLLELTELLAELGDAVPELVEFPPERKSIDIGDYYADYGKAERELGWRPHVGLRDGLARTLAFYRAERPHYW